MEGLTPPKVPARNVTSLERASFCGEPRHASTLPLEGVKSTSPPEDLAVTDWFRHFMMFQNPYRCAAWMGGSFALATAITTRNNCTITSKFTGPLRRIWKRCGFDLIA